MATLRVGTRFLFVAEGELEIVEKISVDKATVVVQLIAKNKNDILFSCSCPRFKYDMNTLQQLKRRLADVVAYCLQTQSDLLQACQQVSKRFNFV